MKIKTNYADVPCWKEVKCEIPHSGILEDAGRKWLAISGGPGMMRQLKMFSSLDPELWKVVGQNPVALLERISYEKTGRSVF